MLLIKSEQMSRIAALLEARFVRDTYQLLSKRYESFNEQYSGASGEEFVRQGIKKAKRFNILRPEDVTVFLQYQVAFGESFEQDETYAPLKKILQIRNLNGTEKIARMRAKLQP